MRGGIDHRSIRVPKFGRDGGQGQVVEDTTLADVRHVLGSVRGEGVHQRVVLAVELHWRNTESAHTARC